MANCKLQAPSAPGYLTPSGDSVCQRADLELVRFASRWSPNVKDVSCASPACARLPAPACLFPPPACSCPATSAAFQFCAGLACCAPLEHRHITFRSLSSVCLCQHAVSLCVVQPMLCSFLAATSKTRSPSIPPNPLPCKPCPVSAIAAGNHKLKSIV